MKGPPEIWLDERVVARMNTHPTPDETADGVEQIRYIHHERAAELILGSQGVEFLIQIVIDDRERTLIGLTNYGRLFSQETDAEIWQELIGPRLEDFPT